MGSDYWRELEAQEIQRRAEREQLERPLLEGEWIGAADALTFLKANANVDDPEKFILRALVREHDSRPMLRAKAKSAKAEPVDVIEPVRRDRIVHSYEWDGDVLFAAWKIGFFELKSSHFSAKRIVTLTGVEFSLADLEAIVGAPESAAAVPARPRRKMYDDKAFVEQAAEILADEGGFGPDFTQADLHAKMEEWCMERWPRAPSRSWMYDRWSEAEVLYKASLS